MVAERLFHNCTPGKEWFRQMVLYFVVVWTVDDQSEVLTSTSSWPMDQTDWKAVTALLWLESVVHRKANHASHQHRPPEQEKPFLPGQAARVS